MRAPKILAVASAVDLDFRYGCTPAWWQLWKGMYEAGIDLVAVSTDEVAGLKETLAADQDGKAPFPFPLYSDSSLAAFKAFRAHDDFEKQPLHGTYLIDHGGHIRWQEISYTPFMQPGWLLEECVRLLALEAAES